MNQSARDSIFQAINGGTAQNTSDNRTIEREAQALLDDPQCARPPRTSDDVVEAFIQRVNGPKVAATVTSIDSLQMLPDAVRKFLSVHALPSAVALQPTDVLTALDWAGAGIVSGADLDGGVAIALALWGIAETGSLVIHSSIDSPILLHFLPAVSIVAVPAGRLLWHLEDYADAARTAGDAAPRNVCLITGASGTTDIEGSLVTGAHGPGELHIIVFDRL